MTTASEERAKSLNEREACAVASTCWAVSGLARGRHANMSEIHWFFQAML